MTGDLGVAANMIGFTCQLLTLPEVQNVTLFAIMSSRD